jgi:hypothetical protein
VDEKVDNEQEEVEVVDSKVVMAKFSSAIWFEPEPNRTEPQVWFKVRR